MMARSSTTEPTCAPALLPAVGWRLEGREEHRGRTSGSSGAIHNLSGLGTRWPTQVTQRSVAACWWRPGGTALAVNKGSNRGEQHGGSTLGGEGGDHW